MQRQYTPGDWVIYRKSKRSTSPGPRAQSVVASTKGEKYSYVVDKFWVVEQVLPGDKVLLRTRRGKLHQVKVDDINLRPARLLERLLYRNRFRNVSPASSMPSGAQAT